MELESDIIYGNVWFDEDLDGLYCDGDDKLADIEVIIYDENKVEVTRELTTISSASSFVITGLEKGNYYIRFSNYKGYQFTQKMLNNPEGSNADRGGYYNSIELDGRVVFNAGFILQPYEVTPTIYSFSRTLQLNEQFDCMKDVLALDYTGKDLTDRVVVLYNDVDTSKAGNYKLELGVNDDYGGGCTDFSYYTVEDDGISRTQVIQDLFESHALIQTATAYILTMEAEKISKVTELSCLASDLIEVNESVEDMVEAVSKLTLINEDTEKLFENCLCK